MWSAKLGSVSTSARKSSRGNRDAADRRRRAHAGDAGAVVDEQRELAEEVSRAELELPGAQLDLDAAVAEDEHPRARGRPRAPARCPAGALERTRAEREAFEADRRSPPRAGEAREAPRRPCPVSIPAPRRRRSDELRSGRLRSSHARARHPPPALRRGSRARRPPRLTGRHAVRSRRPTTEVSVNVTATARPRGCRVRRRDGPVAAAPGSAHGCAPLLRGRVAPVPARAARRLRPLARRTASLSGTWR